MDKHSEYLIPDSIWEAFGINCYEEFIDRFIVTGKFHRNVPEDVKHEFKTIEFLLAHSYFYYPILDVAFFKAMTIFEMAVRIRCNQLKIEVPNKNHTSLNTLLEKLAKVLHPSLPDDWKKVKILRNHLAHPKQSSLMGATIINGLSQSVNILNKLFLSNDFFKDLEIQLNQLKEKAQFFNSGLFILEYNSRRYLISNAIPYLSFNKAGKEISFWGFQPILNEFPQTFNDLAIYTPICLQLTDVMIENEKITANILHTQNPIEVYKTDHALDHAKYLGYITQQSKAEPGVKEAYISFIDRELSKGMVKFVYEEFWT